MSCREAVLAVAVTRTGAGDASTRIEVAVEGGRLQRLAAFGQTEGSSSMGDRKFVVEGATVHAVGVQQDDRVKVAEHGKTEDGSDGDI